jgi:phage shock protein E
MKNLKFISLMFAAVALVVFWGCNARAELSPAAAREHVKRGALVVDVRTVEEFNTKRLTNVVNIPLAEVKAKFSGVVTNQSDVVLLHCRTGRRSGIAETELRALGYTNVFNIGSFEQARKILTAVERK